MSSRTDHAAQTFSQGFNCAQAVFSAFCSQYGLDEKTALKIAAGFGAGLARRGEACGAVTGALMTLGLASAGTEPESKEENYRLAQEFMRRFTDKHQTILCRDLIGCDLDTPEGRQKAQESGVTRTVCPALVQDAVEMLESMLSVK